MKLRTILFLTAVNFLNYFDRYLVAAILPALRNELSLTYEQGGRVVAAFVFGYFLFSPIFGILGDRYDRPKLMSLGVLLWSLATIATGFAGSFYAFLLIRMFVGVGEASFATIAPGFIKDHESDPAKLNHILAIFFTAIPVGSALAYVFAGQIALHLSWEYVFLFGGVPGLILAPMLLRYKDIKKVKAEIPPLSSGLGEIFRVPLLMAAIGGYVLNSFALNGIAAFVTEIGVGIGFSLDNISLYFGLILVGSGFIGTIGGGKIASALSAKSSTPLKTMMLLVGLMSLLAVPFLVATFIVKSQTLFLILCFMVELLVFAAMAPINSILVLAAPSNLITLTQGVTIFALNLFGAFIAPWCIGLAADNFSLPLAMQLTSIALLLCGICWITGAFLRGKAVAIVN